VLAAASVIAKNVFLDYGLVKSDAGQTRATRLLVLAVAALAFLVWAFAKTTLVGLLLVSYNGVTQFFPGVILSFSPRTRPTAAAVAAGICAGLIALAAFAALGISGAWGVNIGFAALGCNLVVLALAQAVTVKRSQGSSAL
jgi:SSS family solute:Na+ symporter